MIGFFDRDVFIKLGCCNLGREAISALSICQPYKLASLQNAASNRRAVSRHFQGEALERHLGLLEAFNEQIDVIPNELIAGLSSSDFFVAMSGKEDIDAGEQILAALVFENLAKSVLLTGDKRFIAAMGQECADQWEMIRGFTITFEGCLLAIHEMFDFDLIYERAMPARECDMITRLLECQLDRNQLS